LGIGLGRRLLCRSNPGGAWRCAGADRVIAAEILTPRDVFGFARRDPRAPAGERPAIERYPAREGSQLAYRFYDSSGERLLVFAHGSSYHGGGYHALASAISSSGAAKVVLPNLQGHYLSGRRRGDVDYVGQLEDDLIDLIRFLRGRGLSGPVTLGGHSSGGGLAIRFAGGGHGDLVSGYLLLSPVIPTSRTVKGGTGGWANLHRQRLYGLIALNMLGIHGYDGLPIVEFNKPEQYWDESETLPYSYRLSACTARASNMTAISARSTTRRWFSLAPPTKRSMPRHCDCCLRQARRARGSRCCRGLITSGYFLVPPRSIRQKRG
jgi:pimeloyl-ACP methyl ester carboxylesterase